MSRTDDRIREHLHSLTRPVAVEGVLDRVQRRRSKRRLRRRIGRAALAVLVVGGSMTATVALSRRFAHRDVSIPSGQDSHSEAGGPFDVACDGSQIQVDADGDGQVNQIDVYSAATSKDDTCEHSDAGRKYVLSISGGKYSTESPHPQPTPYPETRFYGIEQPLPECDRPLECQLFSVVDLNRDGPREIAVQTGWRRDMRSIALYRVDVSPATPPVEHASLDRISVASPGDPWNDRYAIEPGPATLQWGTSPDAVRSISCDSWAGAPALVVTTALPGDGGSWTVHRTFLRLDGGTLTVVDTSDETIANSPALPGGLCGATIWQPGDNP